jgi:putative transposase
MVIQGGLPVQRACQAVGLSRATYYRPLVDWARRNAAVIEALTTLGTHEPPLGVLEIRGSAAEYGPWMEP